MDLEDSNPRRQTAVQRAIALVSEAVDLLDAHGGPPEAAAHLDLGLQELRRASRDPK
jgi:hypothetical protein